MLIQQRGHVISRVLSAASPAQSPEKAAQDLHHYQQPHTATSFTCIKNGGPVFFAIQTKKDLSSKERTNFIDAMVFNRLDKHSFGYAFLTDGPPTILIGQTGKKHQRLSNEDFEIVESKLRAIAAGVGIDIIPIPLEMSKNLPKDWQQASLQSTAVQYTRDSFPRRRR